jgi:hypothetical protein
MRPEILHKKISMPSLGIEFAIFRLAEQFLKQLRHCVSLSGEQDM